MKVTVIFKQTTGPVQYESITFRIDNDDILTVIVKAMEQAAKVTSVPIAEIRVVL